MKTPRIEVSTREQSGIMVISLVISGAEILEVESEYCGIGCKLTPQLAREIAIALEECAARVESY